MNQRQEQFRMLYGQLRIEDQRRYYKERAGEYRTAHHQVVIIRNILLLAAAVTGIVSQTTSDTARAAWAVVGAVLASLAGSVTAYDSLIGFPQLEKLYTDAEQNLQEAAADWGEPATSVADEINRVEWIFRSERGQWGQLVVKSAASTQSTGGATESGNPGEAHAGETDESP
ncbi:SLATT domain-containing protein [Lapillicoccus sp.]|uniref:SLATT domain-containing protein n=1 Tax=Lapillicoccus sp. TaxID=1909287 RepID=UPI0032673BA4